MHRFSPVCPIGKIDIRGQKLQAGTMSTITFDKLAYVDTLKKSGVPEQQARAQADALDIALRDTVATKADIDRLKVWIMGQMLVIVGLMIALRFFD